ncbi:MAG: hypothetical protein A2452_00660 [Candidatus Firestonebacteria bacterium RIFOXYC2_FULL_39_67]|nr:MAG: hypothetical protein A2536_06210 [Candidatus Firestonebacteria bacterium RIFOXYD2_FULL_39_29]OGF53599.1 MAG: hypothetical protein A2497_08390 [Candidatus Firestonebacteria bacterium RifOxyC12_full_39_7]OGF56068.1 MAG: hypothetical protein A2452_00660 [Candidatus Firestonebacteria bacterium RIFOXYC2_FULL_39_67]
MLKVFSARACAFPLIDAAKEFEILNKVKVQIDVCNRGCVKQYSEVTSDEGAPKAGQPETFLQEISRGENYDLVIGSAEYLLDDGEYLGLVLPDMRKTIGYRRSVLIVPKGNPKKIKTLEDCAKSGVKIGISLIDCLKGLWEDVSGRAMLIEPVRKNITLHVNGCIHLVDAVAAGKVDVAFGWNTFNELSPDLEIVELEEKYRIFRGTSIAALKFIKDKELGKKFIAFLTSGAGLEHYRKHGWVIPSK